VLCGCYPAEQPDRLVQLAILHAEFEALHPFLDGNGRLGRMLIPLFLWQVGLISQPMFYISAYFEEHREAYYESLLAVSRDGDWEGWCRFFLQAVQTQANDNLKKAKAILDLYGEMKVRFVEVTRSRYGIRVLDWVFERPIFRSSEFTAQGSIPRATAKRLLAALQADGVLKTLSAGGGRRGAIVAFPALLNIAEGRDVS